MNAYCGNCWDSYFFSNGRLFVKGLAIMNEYIAYDDAIQINYCFN